MQALLSVVGDAVTGATVLRNSAAEDVEVPATGLIVVRDGDVGAPEVTMGLKSWSWQHQAEIEVSAFDDDDEDRAETLDDMVAAIAAAVMADPSLGGAVSYADLQGPVITHEAVEGGVSLGRAMIPAILYYTSSSPTG